MMEESAPSPPIGGVWWHSKTVITSIIGFLLVIPSIVNEVAPFLDEKLRAKALAVAALAGILASLFARKGGVQAAKDTQRSMLPVVMAAIEEKATDALAEERTAFLHPPSGIPETLPTHGRRPPRSNGDTGRFDG